MKTWYSYCFFQIYQLSEEKGIRGGEGRELKIKGDKTGVKIVFAESSYPDVSSLYNLMQ